MAALQQEFPGLPNDNYYLNPAACAVMERIRNAQRREQGRAVDRARLQAKGLPESLADRRDAMRRPDPDDGGQILQWRGPTDEATAARRQWPNHPGGPPDEAAAETSRFRVGQQPDHPPGPADEDVLGVRTAGELLALCRRHDLKVRYEAASDQLMLSRPIATDSVLGDRLRHFRPHLARILQARAAPAASTAYEPGRARHHPLTCCWTDVAPGRHYPAG